MAKTWSDITPAQKTVVFDRGNEKGFRFSLPSGKEQGAAPTRPAATRDSAPTPPLPRR